MSKKVLIIGHARHGKDTVAEMIRDFTGLSFESSSISAAKIFIYDALKPKYGYSSFDHCYKDRVNHRKEWHDLICEYNKDNKARLAERILSTNDIYVGMRSNEEASECLRRGLFDIVIGVFDPNKALEHKDSFDIDIFKLSDLIIITGDIDKTKRNVKLISEFLV